MWRKEFAYQNSWGLSTRSIGAMVMIHGDDKGLVLPPRVAAVQIITIPVGVSAKTTEEAKKNLYDTVESVTQQLLAGGLRAENDTRDNYSPGWKFNHWELKGVPVRFEIGPNDLEKKQVTAIIRHSGEKKQIPLDGIVASVKVLLDEIHAQMYQKVLAIRDSRMKTTSDIEEFKKLLDEKFII
uniref:HGTP_anticodon domain-containing protein n=1 Tax=Caenorhabditis japonica TaxID=281687 RepID=A0A8R1EK89_CAEJA